MRKIMVLVSLVLGILTFAAVAYAGKEGSTFNTAYACVPALLCLMAAIASDQNDEQHLDHDDSEADASAV